MKLEIQSTLIPGTIMDKIKMGNVTGLEFLNKIFYITDGIMLSQIREICGIDGSTLQNWTKRGWVANARSKRYDKNQLARILIINMMRDSMQLDRIAQLLTYVNGRAGDVSDDIIPESELYDYLCRVIDQLVEDELPPDAENVSDLIKRVLTSYEERTAGAAKRLERACGIIIMTYYATLVRQKANSMYDEVFAR
ncbi:MAG: DUF1836 domain-containing protein [Clostridia bacterium]|nr:DUF1836 domain-containing protein [Clostridia bacterium]